MPAWSYSGIKTFAQCPKKYYHLRVAKDVEDTKSEALLYGKEAHTAAEEYVRDDKPLPPVFSYMRKVLDTLKTIPGEKHCELKLGVKKDGANFTPCDFFDKDAWWRGIADLLVVGGSKAFVVDYKTGKNARYADTKQLDLLSGGVFTHFPEVEKVKAALIFVVSNEFIKEEYTRGEKAKCLNTFSWELDRLNSATGSGVWNASPSGLCGWCPVVSCEHNRKG